MRISSAIQIAVVSLMATQAWAGNLTVKGDLTISNLTAQQSITLGGESRTSWPTASDTSVAWTNGVLDTSRSQYYAITLSNHVAWDFQGHENGRMFCLKVAQDATGGWTNSWDAEVVWPGGTRPRTTTRANHWDLFRFVDDGTNWLGMVEGENYSVPCQTNCSQALQFDGGQNYVGCDYATSLYPTALTLELWLKGEGSGWVCGAATSSGGYALLVGEDGVCEAITPGQGSVSGGPSIHGGSWHHVAMTVNGGSIKLFVGGVLVASGSSGSATDAGVGLTVGAVPSMSSYAAFTCDEVRLSSSIRYTGTFPEPTSFTVDSDTISYWKFEDGNESIAHDETGIHNGNLYGDEGLPAWVEGK